VCLHLAAKGDHRSLISLVEKWAESGEPTLPARIAQSRSFLELRMVDKATARMRDLAEATPPNLDALQIVGEGNLLRGWHREARKIAERGLQLSPGHAGFRGLLERTSETPTNPEEDSVEPDSAPPAELIRVAEHHVALGAFVRARALLERVRRKVPEHRWAKDLLWAMEGDYAIDGTLADLCERLGPEVTVLPEVADESEHTESARARDLDLLEERRPNRAFPALFRGLGGPMPDDTGGEPEVTAVSTMAPSAELAASDPAEHTDPAADDTQIVRVLKNTARPAEPEPKDAAPNLAELRAPAARSGRDYAAGGDDEDDALIVHTRREESTDATDQRDLGLTEELEIEKKATKKGAVEDAHWAATPMGAPRTLPVGASPPHRRVDAAAQAASPKEPKSLAAKAPPATPTPVPATRTSRPSAGPSPGMSMWVLAMAGLFGFAALVFAFLAVVVAVGS
jgi:hypothetical protein